MTLGEEMQVVWDEASKIVTFIPTVGLEKEILADMSAYLRIGDKLKYGGYKRDVENEDYVTLSLSTRSDNSGGPELQLTGDRDEDKYLISTIVRDACYLGGGLSFLCQNIRAEERSLSFYVTSPLDFARSLQDPSVS